MDIFNGVFVKERGLTALGFLYTLVTYTEERLSELEKKMNSEKVAGNTTDLTPDAYKKYMVNSSYADLINETDIKSITVEGDKLSCVVCSSWAEVVVVLKDCNFDGVLDSKRFVHGLYCSCGKTKDTLIPCQHLIKVLRYCAKIKFCDASIQKRVPVVLKHEFLKQGYSGWKENYTGVENIFHLKSRRLVGQSSKSYSKRKRRYEKKGKARGQRAELEKEKRALEQSRLAMNRKEFLERLIKEVDLSGPNKEEIAAELNKKINDFMSHEDSSGSQEVDYDEEDEEESYYISSSSSEEEEEEEEESLFSLPYTSDDYNEQ